MVVISFVNNHTEGPPAWSICQNSSPIKNRLSALWLSDVISSHKSDIAFREYTSQVLREYTSLRELVIVLSGSIRHYVN